MNQFLLFLQSSRKLCQWFSIQFRAFIPDIHCATNKLILWSRNLISVFKVIVPGVNIIRELIVLLVFCSKPLKVKKTKTYLEPTQKLSYFTKFPTAILSGIFTAVLVQVYRLYKFYLKMLINILHSIGVDHDMKNLE